MRPLWGILAGLALVVSPASARYSQTAKVRYQTEQGQSEWYTVTVNFLTGMELNRATNSLRYQGLSKYAVVFWSQDQATVILLNTLIICGTEFEQLCLPVHGHMQGSDQQDRSWEVCTALYC